MWLRIAYVILPATLAARLALSMSLVLGVSLAGLVLMPTPVRAATITSTGADGVWGTGATWIPAQVPVAGDVVTIAVGSPVTVAALAACASIDVTGTLTIGGGIILTVSDNGSGAETISTTNNGSAVTLGGDWGCVE